MFDHLHFLAQFFKLTCQVAAFQRPQQHAGQVANCIGRFHVKLAPADLVHRPAQQRHHISHGLQRHLSSRGREYHGPPAAFSSAPPAALGSLLGPVGAVEEAPAGAGQGRGLAPTTIRLDELASCLAETTWRRAGHLPPLPGLACWKNDADRIGQEARAADVVPQKALPAQVLAEALSRFYFATRPSQDASETSHRLTNTVMSRFVATS
jgi:hypothetical protein